MCSIRIKSEGVLIILLMMSTLCIYVSNHSVSLSVSCIYAFNLYKHCGLRGRVCVRVCVRTGDANRP